MNRARDRFRNFRSESLSSPARMAPRCATSSRCCDREIAVCSSSSVPRKFKVIARRWRSPPQFAEWGDGVARMSSSLGEAVAMAEELGRRGIGEPAAKLTAETGVAVFKVAFDRWINATKDTDLAQVVGESLDELRALTAST